MTFLNPTRPAILPARSAIAGAYFAVVRFFGNIAESFRQYRAFSQTYEELNSLSQRELDDLGIERSMITRIAMEAAYGN